MSVIEAPATGVWMRHGRDIVRIEQWAEYAHDTWETIPEWETMNEAQKILTQEHCPPWTHVARDEDGLATVYPSIPESGDDELCSEDEPPEGWPWPRTDPDVIVCMNERGNATAWMRFEVSRIVPGQTGMPRPEQLPRTTIAFEGSVRIKAPVDACPQQRWNAPIAERDAGMARALQNIAEQAGLEYDEDERAETMWETLLEEANERINENMVLTSREGTLSLGASAPARDPEIEGLPTKHQWWTETIEGQTLIVELMTGSRILWACV